MKRERECIRSSAPAASSPNVRRNMQAVMRQDTALSVLLRRHLHVGGLRFRKEIPSEPGLRINAHFLPFPSFCFSGLKGRFL